MNNSVSLYSFVRFNTWIDNFGVQKAGLSPNAMSELYQASSAFQARAMGLRNYLLKVRNSWQDILDNHLGKAAGDNAAIKGNIQRLVVELYDVKLTTGAMLNDAANLKGLTIQAKSLVGSHVAADSGKLQGILLELGQATRQLEMAYLQLQQARSELDGGKGFANGLATVFSLGIYNPLKNNIEKANRAVTSANIEHNRLANLRNAQSRCVSEQAEGQTLLGNLVDVDQVLTNVQNALNTALTTVSSAYDNESKYVASQTSGAATYYFNAGAKDMDKLFIWMDSFFTPAGAIQAKPDNVCSHVRGTYEHHPQDPGTKNDWHYVTIIKLSDQSAMWTNRAGVSWVLNRTPLLTQLETGPDCPYYDIHKQVIIHWQDNEVTGVIGPGNALYVKS